MDASEDTFCIPGNPGCSLPVGLGWGHFRVQGPPGRSQHLDSPIAEVQQNVQERSGRRLAIGKCSVFNELPWDSRQCFWVGRTVGRVQLAREGEEETPRRVCLTHAGRMTGLPATALGSAREASVRGLCIRGCAVSLRQPSGRRCSPPPKPPPTSGMVP